MPTCLALLPFELSKIIFDQVDRKDIHSLRLTCSSLRSTTLHHFRLAFAHRTTDLSPSSLLSLIKICENEDLSSAIKQLTIDAAFRDPAWLKPGSLRSNGPHAAEEEDRAAPCITPPLRIRATDINEAAASQSDLRLLTTALQRASNLRTITLESGVYQGPEVRLPVSQSGGAWHEVWKRAFHVFSVTMMALARSRSHLDELHIYGGYWGCGVPAYDIYRLMPNLITKGLGEVLVNLRVLTLSYSTPLLDGGLFDTEQFDEEKYLTSPFRNTSSDTFLPSLAFAQRNYLGPASFLALCPNLEDLVISLYYRHPLGSFSREDASVSDGEHEEVSEHNAQAIQMPKLLSCKISDQIIRQHALLQVLRDNPELKTLDSRFVALVEACRWGPFLDDCKQCCVPIDGR